MANKNIWDPNPPPEEIQPDDNTNMPFGKMAVIGWNLLALVIYTLALKFTSDGAGYIFDALILFFHVIFCLGMPLAEEAGFGY